MPGCVMLGRDGYMACEEGDFANCDSKGWMVWAFGRLGRTLLR